MMSKTPDKHPMGILKPCRTGPDPGSGLSWLNRIRNVPALGLILACMGGIAFAFALSLAKVSNVYPLLVLFERSILQFLVFLCAVIYNGHKQMGILDRKSLFFVNLDAIFGAMFPVFCHVAMFYIPVADVIALFFASPAFITLFTCVAFKENPGVWRIFVLGLALAGVIIVTRPVFMFGTDEDTSHVSWVEGCILAIGSSISYSGFCITSNYIKGIPAESLNLLVSTYTMLLSIPILAGLNKFQLPGCAWEAIIALLSCIAGVLAVLFLILATKLEKAGPVSIGNAIELPAIIVLQILLMGEMPSWHCYLGSALIVTSVLISGWLKWVQDKKEEQKVNLKPLEGKKESVDLSLLEESVV